MKSQTIERCASFLSAAEWGDAEPGVVPGPLRKTAGAPAPAGPAVPQAAPPVRALRGDDL